MFTDAFQSRCVFFCFLYVWQTLGFHGDNSLQYFPSLLDFPLVNTSLLSTKTDY